MGKFPQPFCHGAGEVRHILIRPPEDGDNSVVEGGHEEQG